MSKLPLRRISIGIDPGTYGGLAAIIEYPSAGNREPDVVWTTMPDSQREIYRWFGEFPMPSDQNQVAVCLEKVHSMPKMGVKAMFTFGQNFGMLKMAIEAYGRCTLEPDLVRPEVWQRELGLRLIKNETKTARKERLRVLASKKFKQLGIWKIPKTKGIQMKIADALLLSLYCQKTRS